MERLPFEIRGTILDFVDNINLKAIRLLNHTWRDQATPHLFRCVYLTTRTDSFEKLAEICSSELSRHVRCLHYNIWELPRISRHEWKRAIKQLLCRCPNANFQHLPTYDDYLAYYGLQVQHFEAVLLTGIFQRLPSLRSLEISEHEPTELSARKNILKMEDVVEFARRRGYLANDPWDGPKDRTSKALTAIIVHGEVHASLQSLTLTGFRWHWLDMHDIRIWHGSTILHSALQNLRHFRLSVAGGVDDGEDPDSAAAMDVWRGLIGLTDRPYDDEVLVGDGYEKVDTGRWKSIVDGS
jgi:hypothetical protein